MESLKPLREAEARYDVMPEAVRIACRPAPTAAQHAVQDDIAAARRRWQWQHNIRPLGHACARAHRAAAIGTPGARADWRALRRALAHELAIWGAFRTASRR